jgi:hypothetical protein
MPRRVIGGAPARDTIRYVRVGIGGTLLNEIGTFVGGARQTIVPTTAQKAPEGTVALRSSTRVERDVVNRPMWVVAKDSAVLYMDDSSNEVRIHSMRGRLQRIVRLPGPPLFGRPNPAPGPGNRGISLGFLVDDAGQIWIEQFRLPTDPQPTWLVLDSGGRSLGIGRTPPGLWILSIGGNHLLGLRRDSDGVESVESYDLTHRGTPGD